MTFGPECFVTNVTGMRLASFQGRGTVLSSEVHCTVRWNRSESKQCSSGPSYIILELTSLITGRSFGEMKLEREPSYFSFVVFSLRVDP